MDLGTTLGAVVATGFLGSWHCAAMCGPLATAGCTRNGRLTGRDAAGYFAGRLLSYATLGAIMGHLGQHALHVLPMDTVQMVAALAVAALTAVRGVRLLWPRRPALVRLGGRLGAQLGAQPGAQLGGQPSARVGAAPDGSRRSARSAPGAWIGVSRLIASAVPRRGLGLGLATGVLPCGMLVVGWTLAAGTTSAPGGALAMTVFALASTPGLWAPVLGKRLLEGRLTRLPVYAQGVAWCAVALWIGVRPWLGAGHDH